MLMCVVTLRNRQHCRLPWLVGKETPFHGASPGTQSGSRLEPHTTLQELCHSACVRCPVSGPSREGPDFQGQTAKVTLHLSTIVQTQQGLLLAQSLELLSRASCRPARRSGWARQDQWAQIKLLFVLDTRRPSFSALQPLGIMVRAWFFGL